MKLYGIICTDNRGIIATIVLTLLVSVFGFYEYLFQGQLFFVSAGDTLTQMFPHIIEMHYQLYDNESLMWSFYQGLGAPIFAGNPNHHGDIFAWILAALPIDCMSTGIIYIHILKLVCAASLFYVFLSQFNSLSIVTKIIGSMCYAFSGVMLCRGPWWHYATEVVMIVPVLIGLEKWYRNNNSFFIVVSFALLLISRYATYAYVYSIYVYGYIILRSVCDGNSSPLNLLKKLVSFSSRYLMGMGLAAIFLIPGIINFFESARISGNIWLNVGNAFSVTNSKVIMSNILKFYQPNITGIFETGIGNVLEDVCGYSGILFLLLCASIFVGKASFAKKGIFLVIIFIALYIITIFPKSLLNAFAYNSAKTSSIWINIALITLGVHILERIDSRKILIAGTGLLCLFGITFLKYKFTGLPIVLEEVYCAVVFLIAYMIILLLYSYRKIDKCKYATLLLCTLIVESCISCRFSSIQVNYMKMLSQKNVWEILYHKHENLGNLYNNDFFRIALLHKNVVLESDASINRYYGFDRYNSINGKSIVDFTDLFYNNMGNAKSHHMHGLNDYEGIRNMFSGKYICDDSTGEIIVNQDCMPLGYLYDYYANVNDVDKYPSNIRDDIISKAAIVSDSVSNIKNYFDSFDVFKTSNYNLKKLYTNDLQEVNAVGNGRYNIIGDDPFIVYEIPEVVNINNDILSMDVDVHVRRSNSDSPDISNMNYQVYFSADSNGFCEDGSFFTSIRNDKSSPYLPKYIDGSKFFRLDIGRKGQILELSNVNLSTWDIKPRNGDENYKPYVPIDKNSICEMKKFSSTEIHLQANNDTPRILFLSIPYDSGWSIYDNGKQVEVMHVNIGFIGTYLEPGEHNLFVQYRTPGLYEGAVVSGATAIGLLYMCIRRRKNREVKNAI